MVDSTNKPTIIPVDDRIQIQEITPNKKITPTIIQQPVTTVYEVVEEPPLDEIPTIVPTIPKPTTAEIDTAWLNEAAAEEILNKDPYSNPEVQIETHSTFVDVPAAKEEEFIEEIHMQVNLPDGVDLSQATPEMITSAMEKAMDTTPTISSEEPVEPGFDIPNSPTIGDDWDSNVQEDVPVVDPTLQPGMETMDTPTSTGPVRLDDIEEQEEHIELSETESVTPPSPSLQINANDLPEPDDIDPVKEDILTDNEAPVIPTYGFFHTPQKETLIPLHREELAQQFTEIFPDDNVDSPHIQRLKSDAVQNPSTFPSYVARSTNFTSPEQGRLTDIFKSMEGPIGAKKKIDDKVYGDAFSSKTNSRPLHTTSIVGGEKAFHTAMALISGIRRIALYNSGFNITIRPPLLGELHQFYMSTRSTAQEFGRQFGQYAFIPADVELKMAGVKLFKSLILDSNLANWREPGVLERNISLFDYDTLLWGMASLMFPEGTEVEMFCNNRTCNHVDVAKIDVVKMRFNDYSRINNEAIKFVCSADTKNPRTEEDLKNYKEQMLQESETIQLTDEWSISVETPSLEKYIEDGAAYAADMAAKVQMRNPLDVADYIRCKYFRIFAPWIKQISFLDKRTGHYNHWNDPIKMPDIIETLQLEKHQIPLDAKLTEYMSKKRVSYFGYLYSGCPNCKTISDMTINGIIPCDMQQSFFTLTMDRIS